MMEKLRSVTDNKNELYTNSQARLLKLLNTDFSVAIKDLLSPLLIDSFEYIRKDGRWHEGFKAIEYFLNG